MDGLASLYKNKKGDRKKNVKDSITCPCKKSWSLSCGGNTLGCSVGFCVQIKREGPLDWNSDRNQSTSPIAFTHNSINKLEETGQLLLLQIFVFLFGLVFISHFLICGKKIYVFLLSFPPLFHRKQRDTTYEIYIFLYCGLQLHGARLVNLPL